MTERTSTGGCLCGAVRYEAKGEPFWVAHCHCHSCRRNTGSAVATFVGYSQADFAYSTGAPAGYASSPGVTRGFCARCGTPLTYESERCPGEVHLYISTLDRPEDFEPRGHVFFAEKIPWFDTADHLPRYAGLSRGGAAPVAGFDSEAFLDRFAEVWQNHDLEGVAETFTDDAVFEASFGPEPHGERAVGKEAAVRLAASVFERIPDVRFAPIRRFATPGFAVVEQVQAGTPRGGEPFEVHIVDLLTLRDGKIAAKRTYRKARRS